MFYVLVLPNTPLVRDYHTEEIIRNVSTRSIVVKKKKNKFMECWFALCMTPQSDERKKKSFCQHFNFTKGKCNT